MPIFPLYNQTCRFHIPMLKTTVCHTINFVTLWIAEGQISTFAYFFTSMEIPFPLRAQLVYLFTSSFSPVQQGFRMLNTFKCFGDMSVK